MKMQHTDLSMAHMPALPQGRALNESADKDCKMIVVGNPCNTNALIAMENAPRLNRRCELVHDSMLQ